MSKKKQSKNSQKKTSQNLAIICLLLNILILPGLGSLIGGRTKEGIWQLVLVFGGIALGVSLILTLVGIPLGVLVLLGAPLAAWIWGISTGIKLLQEAK